MQGYAALLPIKEIVVYQDVHDLGDGAGAAVGPLSHLLPLLHRGHLRVRISKAMVLRSRLLTPGEELPDPARARRPARSTGRP